MIPTNYYSPKEKKIRHDTQKFGEILCGDPVGGGNVKIE